ncbi:MAG TPA: TetR/AcrR family transcriptional regulator [Rhizomicrobium sp.]|nr:TetR/AcrR family transcriptional regulator [Rhizomicrobium sp.]
MHGTTQARIFAAARELFDQGGAEGVSMRRIAEKVGITPMAIYKHYPDKDALLNALMLDGFAAWEGRVAALTAAEPLAWALAMGEAFLDFALKEPRRYEAAFLLKANAARRYPGDFVAGRSPVISKMMAHIDQAKAQGLVADIPTIDIVISFTALTQGLVDMYRAGRFSDETDFRAAYRKALVHCVQSFGKKKS